MKFKGIGQLADFSISPDKNQVLWDFDADGVLETDDPKLIKLAQEKGIPEYVEGQEEPVIKKAKRAKEKEE